MASHKRKPFDKLLKGKYTSESLGKAVSWVVNGESDEHDAAKEFNISVRTVSRHVK